MTLPAMAMHVTESSKPVEIILRMRSCPATSRLLATALLLALPPVAGAQQHSLAMGAGSPDSLGRRGPRESTLPLQGSRPWYEPLSLRGYGQLRYNRLFESNRSSTCPCDRSIGNNQGFFLGRAGLVLSGEVHERVSIYIQPD